MNQKGFANIILVIVILALLGAVGYFVFVKKSEPITQQPTPTPTQTKTPVSPTPAPTANWKTYTNSQYGFEFKYPATFVLGQNPLINDWSKPIEEGTAGTFWQKIAKNNWQERLAKKSSYQIGSSCTINADNFEESCKVISISPYVMKFVEMTATGKVNTYRVINNYVEVVFGPVVPRDGAVLDGASDQILATFKFTK